MFSSKTVLFCYDIFVFYFIFLPYCIGQNFQNYVKSGNTNSFVLDLRQELFTFSWLCTRLAVDILKMFFIKAEVVPLYSYFSESFYN